VSEPSAVKPPKVAAAPSPARHGTWPVLIFALVFPTVMAWAEYTFTPGGKAGPKVALQVGYALGKLVQLTLPLVFVLYSTGRLPRPGKPTFEGLVPGVVFGLVVGAGAMVLYLFLRDSWVFQDTPARVRTKLDEFGLNSPPGFAAFAVFITVLHSLLEEYYWRWFVFGQLVRLLSLSAAIALSSLGFMTFHVFLLNAYLPGHFWSAVIPFTLCVGAGGCAWAWLYHRTGSIYAPWLSHLLVDASLFVIGYDLFFVRGGQ
jgi:membrane protease YdiL (CAAX protease family)